ncbi:hypothetical protein L6164_016236 [Bauhinia variegata]|uniref:Uncharacterized protein n=1 Tax=Bauhinia variegata TaxID=167791 RepID=A0ACB9NN97_BAUVA|nr:hypothetical protein L6164_016236 [Bauhinia variegata]
MGIINNLYGYRIDDPADEDYQLFLDEELACMSKKGIKRECEGSNSGKEKTGSPAEYGNNLKSEGVVTGKERKSMLVGQKLHVSDGLNRANITPTSHVSCVAGHKVNIGLDCDLADKDYQQYLDSHMVDDENLARMCVKRKCDSNNSGRAKTQSPIESGKNLMSDVAGKEEKSMLVGQNLQVSNGVIGVNKTPSSHVSCLDRHRSNIELECDLADEDYQQYLDSHMVDDENLARISEKGIKRKCERSNSGRAKTQSPTESGKDLKSEGDVAAKEGKFSFLGQNLQVSDCIILPSNDRSCSNISNVAMCKCRNEVQCDSEDEDYQEYLSSGIDGENVDDCSSSDSELVIMDSDPYHENTPFISSKTYDSSWFADEGNYGDNWLVSANQDSQFRKGLTDILERPYDQGEYERYWQEITCQKPKERHRETRSGKIESCPVTGANKSYLELHKDLKKAIDGAKEQHMVLLYLRGFFYWLEHLTQEGSFRPWLDASCLEMLTKM